MILLRLFSAIMLIAFGISAGARADDARITYVNTSGTAIQDSDIGPYCRPLEMLADGRIMVFGKTASDLALYSTRLEANGVTDPNERRQMVEAASTDTCERKAGNKCSEGTCSSGTCKQKFTGGMTSCSCQ